MHPWDGRWLVLSVPIPETQRQLRHRLRTRLTWLGLGSPTSGLWVTPDATLDRAVHEVIRDLGLEDQAFAWTGSASGLGDEQRLLADAWDLADVEDRYLSFLGDFEDARPPAPRRRPSSPRSSWCRSGAASRSWTPTCPPSCSTTTGPAPARPPPSTTGTPAWHADAQAEWDRMDAAARPGAAGPP